MRSFLLPGSYEVAEWISVCKEYIDYEVSEWISVCKEYIDYEVAECISVAEQKSKKEYVDRLERMLKKKEM